MALLASPRISGIVLVDAVGIEVENHAVADVSGLSVPEIQALSFHDPTPFRVVDPATIPDAQKAIMAANGAAVAVYAGSPAMADPTLLARLGAITIPTLVLWGESDQIVEPVYGQAYAAAIDGRGSRYCQRPGTCPRWRLPVSCCKRSGTRAKAATSGALPALIPDRPRSRPQDVAGVRHKSMPRRRRSGQWWRAHRR